MLDLAESHLAAKHAKLILQRDLLGAHILAAEQTEAAEDSIFVSNYLEILVVASLVARVHYEPGKPPWVASRLQDFFGIRESPRVGRDRVPLVIHLLAPNQRPVQTTTDLAGFWQRLYPQLRRELGRRYPKHAWPENPV